MRRFTAKTETLPCGVVPQNQRPWFFVGNWRIDGVAAASQVVHIRKDLVHKCWVDRVGDGKVIWYIILNVVVKNKLSWTTTLSINNGYYCWVKS